MKIGCIGNTNNMLFTLCRYLRDEGYDAHLFLFNDEAEHFLPEADSYDDDYLQYTSFLGVGKSTLYFRENIKQAGEALKDCDFFIGTDIAPALLTLLGKTLHIFVPHGSDIYSYPFEIKPNPGVSKVWWLQTNYYVGQMQKIGIEAAELILFPDEYDLHFPFKQKLKTTGVYHSATVPMLYVPQYRRAGPSRYKELAHSEVFNNVRQNNDLVIFSHARQNGSDLPAHEKVHEKGNHKLIKAFAEFLQQRPDLRSCLVLFEYGMDIDSAKELIKKLDIIDHVSWMPKMQRREILYGLQLADICCGEFENSWLTCGVVNETLAVGKPLLHYRNDKLYTDDFAELYPVLNARSENEILEQLLYFAANREAVEMQFKNTSRWIEKYTVTAPLRIVTESINTSRTGLQKPGPGKKIRLQVIRIECLIRRAIHKAPGKVRKIFGKSSGK